MRELLLKRVRPLVDRLAEDLASLAVERLEAELVRIEEALTVALSSYQSDSPPNLIAAALGPELAKILDAPEKKPHRKRERVREYEPENYPPSRRAREQRTEPQKNGAKPITCSKCGFVGGNARGCGTAHPTLTATAKPALLGEFFGIKPAQPPSAPPAPADTSKADRFALLEARARARQGNTDA
jgi:hypothetical protein